MKRLWTLRLALVVALTFGVVTLIATPGFAGLVLQPGGGTLRTVTLPTHTGVGVDTTDTFVGQPRPDGECWTYVARDGSTILPIWPPRWYAKVGPRFAGVYRPGDADAYNVISELLEFRGERVAVTYKELDLRLRSEVLEACRPHEMLLVVEAIWRS